MNYQEFIAEIEYRHQNKEEIILQSAYYRDWGVRDLVAHIDACSSNPDVIFMYAFQRVTPKSPITSITVTEIHKALPKHNLAEKVYEHVVTFAPPKEE